ncbi:MAG: ABC transporter ATP-binding protein, partial [Candidatus Omnitrophica bacterium]|nr:ABC transporter ATP-binding protein [Candidatus Omnitrophota bacterium]
LVDILIKKLRMKFSFEVNYDLTGRLFGSPYLVIKKASSSESAFFVDYDYANIENIVFEQVPSLGALFKIPVFFVLGAAISVPLMLIVFLTIPFFVIHAIWFSKRGKRYMAKEMYFSRKYFSWFRDILANIKIIKSFFKEIWAREKVFSLFKGKTEKEYNNFYFITKSNAISNIITKLSIVLFGIVGGLLVINGGMTFGALTAATMYAGIILSELFSISAVLQGINSERYSIRRCAEFVKEITSREKIAHLEDHGPCDMDFCRGLEFKNIAFSYPNGKELFQDLSFEADGGRWTLIQGKSGAGKTTLINIFLGLLTPASGAIYAGGVDVKKIRHKYFAEVVSASHQESLLFNDTIIGNVLFGDEKFRGNLKKVIYCVELDELVSDPLIGYNGYVGEFGSSLSGGQRQRISLARALIREPKILVMDEATSFLNYEMENRIFSKIKKEYPWLTVIFISHRKTAREFADRTFLLEDGKIREDQTGI